MNIAHNGLEAFVSKLPQWPELQRQLKTCQSPEQILLIARQYGFFFSLSELRKASHHLASDHWPWAAKGSNWRRAFFADVAAL